MFGREGMHAFDTQPYNNDITPYSHENEAGVNREYMEFITGVLNSSNPIHSIFIAMEQIIQYGADYLDSQEGLDPRLQLFKEYFASANKNITTEDIINALMQNRSNTEFAESVISFIRSKFVQ